MVLDEFAKAMMYAKDGIDAISVTLRAVDSPQGGAVVTVEGFDTADTGRTWTAVGRATAWYT